ncbi:heme oxygenase-like protein [Fomitiporia mediterranea MF3/22]|uniref:heme oxygenase-like protein n=1 Tax=Fomitiporia mediterranea (strain MF3/22) TaxID=694068 RepID=UPI0004409CE3|nr:heme oxygenase-like protein [Fomitiporia mediterranea MF3/22]EJC99021.1 heme oxygenase-like protein [Fomitiporia mediterranea MF3/22]
MSTKDDLRIDYTQPLATLLKLATSAAHESAEHSQGAGWLTRGELDKEEYVRFLMMLYHVYDTLETALERHSSHPVLAPTYNPALLARAPSLAADIAYLLDVPETSWVEHTIHQELQRSPPEPFESYVSRLKYLAYEAPDPSPLLAHAYVRYLGDLSGGQTIRRNIAKAYGVDHELSSSSKGDSRGTQFYEFRQLGSSKPASIGDMKKIKEWFRAGMNQGGGDDAAKKQAIAEEAVYAFELNEGLFTLLRPPSTKSASQAPAAAPLGNPSDSPPLSTAPSQANMNGNGNAHANGHASANGHANVNGEAKYSPLMLQPPPEPEESAYSLSTILTVIMAVGLAHFVLVTGGFTGAKGFGKLETALEWFGDRMHSVFG